MINAENHHALEMLQFTHVSVVFWFGPSCGCSARLIWPRLVGPWLGAGCCGSWGGDEEIEGVGVRGDS